jgi:hypothetical protein
MRIREATDGEMSFDDLVTVGRSLGTILAGGLLLVLTAHVLFLFLVSPGSALLPFGSIFAMIAGVWTRDFIEGHVGRPSWPIGLAPLVFLGHGILSVKAVLEYSFTWNGEWFQVRKNGT